MANQKKPISELGYAKSGGSTKTLAGLDSEVQSLDLNKISNLNDLPAWGRVISDLFRVDLTEFNTLRYACCKVGNDVTDFPADLKETDTAAYVMTHRSNRDGMQLLIGAQSGTIVTRRKNGEELTGWTYTNSKGGTYATFEIDPVTGELFMHTAPGYTGVSFTLENGSLFVNI